jgi:hypothetical protein
MVCLAVAFVPFQVEPAHAVTNWLSGFNYRVSHKITKTTGADVNYPVEVTVVNASGGGLDDTFNTTYCTATDFGDVRFTMLDNTTELNYTRKNVFTGANATFVVNIPGNLSSDDQYFYMYYGNSTATTTSNPDNTFLVYEDFNDIGEWTDDHSGSGTNSIAGGYLNVSQAANKYCHLQQGFTQSTNFMVEWNMTEVYNVTQDGRWFSSVCIYQSAGSHYRMGIVNGTSGLSLMLMKRIGSTVFTNETSAGLDFNSTYWLRLVVNGTAMRMYNSSNGVDYTALGGGFVLGTLNTGITYLIIGKGYGTAHGGGYESATLNNDYATAGDNEESWFDNLMVRRFVEPEPVHGVWGTEESSEEGEGEEYGPNQYVFVGPYDEDTNAALDNANVTVYYDMLDTEQFMLDGIHTYTSLGVPRYFYIDMGATHREYWCSPSETSGMIYVYNASALTTYTFTFKDLAGTLDIANFVMAQRYVNGSLHTVEKRRVDIEDKVLLNLEPETTYTIVLADGDISYTFGDLTVTSSTTEVSLTIKGIEFPQDIILAYQYVRVYGTREFQSPNGTITIVYEDTLELTVSVTILIYQSSVTLVYNSTQTSSSFTVAWSNAENDTDYNVVCSISHGQFGNLGWNQYFAREGFGHAAWSLDFLGTLPFATSQLLPALLIIFAFGCFSVLNRYVGVFFGIATAALLAYMGWISIGASAIVAAFTLGILFAISEARRRYY